MFCPRDVLLHSLCSQLQGFFGRLLLTRSDDIPLPSTRENCIVIVMQDVTFTIEIRMKSRKFLTKYDYILNMHKIIKYNNKL